MPPTPKGGMAFLNKHNNRTVSRAALPEVLFASDMALAMSLPETQTRAAAEAGCFGPLFFVDGRVAVLRRDFLEFLALRASCESMDAKEVL